MSKLSKRVYYHSDKRGNNETVQLLTVFDSEDEDEESGRRISSCRAVKPLPSVENGSGSNSSLFIDQPPTPRNNAIVIVKEQVEPVEIMHRHPRPSSHFTLALVACLCCCPLGLVVLLRSHQVQRYYNAGKVDKARQCSNHVYRLSNKSIFIGCILHSSILAFLLTIAIVATILLKPNQYY